MNVLVYSGPGSTVESVKCCTDTLRQLLSPNYCVLNVTSHVICNEPWAASTALLALPGGADLPYCRDLNGKGNDAIKKYVRRGGRFIGFCAGGYYGSNKVEFETGTPLEVTGPRELGFFPGIARGTVFPGFQYGQETGITAANIKSNLADVKFKCYYDGGGYFVDAQSKKDVEVLAEYDDQDTNIKFKKAYNGGSPLAAAVYCKFGSGSAVLTGIHPEFSVGSLKTTIKDPNGNRASVLKQIEQDDNVRLAFMKSLLEKMGLNPSDGGAPPLISRLSLTSQRPERLKFLLEKIKEHEGFQNGNQYVGLNDTFEFHDSTENLFDQPNTDPEDEIKKVDVFNSGLPDAKFTPHFDHNVYYNHLALEQNDQAAEIGSTILYGEVVTSTSTMLDKNYGMLRHLPQGFAAVGTIQVQGRGRGNNVWVNPTGVLAVSTVLRIPIAATAQMPIVFVQYLVSLAMVESIRSYGPGYQDMPVRLKWPNDLYAMNPAASANGLNINDPNNYLKIGGVLINTNIVDGHYVLVFGLGVNVANAAPSTSVNLILDALNSQRQAAGKSTLEPYKIEVLLAKFMARFERMLRTFAYTGFREFEQLYYERWLHSDQLVTLEQHGNIKARVKGISTDAGLLVASAIDDKGLETGTRFELQPDGNSFDMFRGLLKKKQ